MNRLVGAIICAATCVASIICAESPNYFVYVSNERSGDVTVIDGASDTIVATFPVGKRPRGIHAASDGKRVFVVTSGSPRMAPGVDAERAPVDKTADGLAVIDASVHKLVDRSNLQFPEMGNSRSSQMRMMRAH